MASPWRTATASFLLAAGLSTTFGGAVAMAEPDTGGGTSGGGTSGTGDAADGSATHDSPSPSGAGSGAAAVHAALNDIANRLGAALPAGSGRLPGTTTGASKASALPDPFAATAHITRTVTGILTPKPAPVEPPTISDSAGSSPAAVIEQAPAAQVVSQPVNTTPIPTATGSLPPTAPSAPLDLAAPVAAVAAAAQNLVVPITNQIAAVPAALTAQIPNVLDAIRYVLTSTNGAVTPFVQLPADFASLLDYSATPAVGVGAESRPPVSATVPASLQAVEALIGGANVVTGGPALPMSTTPVGLPAALPATAALDRASSPVAVAKVTADSTFPATVAQFLHGYGGMIVAASLAALFGAALPGILGFLLPTAAGVHLGYRQAKAGSTLRSSGIARFAGSGPVGIVRAGALIAFRPRATVAARDSGERHLKSVA